MENSPLVTVGIPTFNRSKSLIRAIRSAVSQSYRNLEIIISDNGSTDETAAMCQGFLADKRVQYHRWSINHGGTANFARLLELGTGEYFIFLADDDWLDTEFIHKCVSVLSQNRTLAIVCGETFYYHNENLAIKVKEPEFMGDSPALRVLEYFRSVERNGMFYGVMRRELMSKFQVRALMADDWLALAGMVFVGKVANADGAVLNRSLVEVPRSEYRIRVAKSLGIPSICSPAWGAITSYLILKEIGWSSSIYSTLSLSRRLALGFSCGSLIFIRYFLMYVFPRRIRRTIWGSREFILRPEE